MEKVLVPPNAFSGLAFEVSWIVRNIGKVGNALVTWYDSVYIGKSTDFSSARFVSKIELIIFKYSNVWITVGIISDIKYSNGWITVGIISDIISV